jgi:hypothetical protein
MLTITLPQGTPETAVTGLDNPSWIRRAMLLERVAEAYADRTLTAAQHRQAEDIFRTAFTTMSRSPAASSPMSSSA